MSLDPSAPLDAGHQQEGETGRHGFEDFPMVFMFHVKPYDRTGYNFALGKGLAPGYSATCVRLDRARQNLCRIVE
ncbi:hypothetical protein [Castellaniella sp.]|uniref:hypothetical protein n=1 Tax=Castellaniella sp. TaxID=1955812 RepID=UPI00355E6F57